MKTYLLFFLASIFCYKNAYCNDFVVVDSRVKGCDVVLDFTFVNNLDREVIIAKTYLPWTNGLGGADLHIKTVPGNSLIEQLRGLMHRQGYIPVNAGEKLRGQVDLNERVPELSEVLKRTDVLVFWSHWMRLEDEIDPIISFGSIRLKKCK